jgi:hypothetical protein
MPKCLTTATKTKTPQTRYRKGHQPLPITIPREASGREHQHHSLLPMPRKGQSLHLRWTPNSRSTLDQPQRLPVTPATGRSLRLLERNLDFSGSQRQNGIHEFDTPLLLHPLRRCKQSLMVLNARSRYVTDRTAMGCHAVMNTSFRRYRFLSWTARSMFRTGVVGINESIAKLVGSMAPKHHCRDCVLPNPPQGSLKFDVTINTPPRDEIL